MNSLNNTSNARRTRAWMTKVNAFMNADVFLARCGFQWFSANISTRMWSLASPFINGIYLFSTEAFILSGRIFSDKLTSRTSPTSLIICSCDFRPLFDAMNVEDIKTFAITMPSGIFRSDLIQRNHDDSLGRLRTRRLKDIARDDGCETSSEGGATHDAS